MTRTKEVVEERPGKGFAASGVADGWPASVGVVIASIVAVVALYWGTASSMEAIWWRSNTYAHGYLIVPLSAYMIWSRRRSLAVITPRPAPWVLPAVLLTAVTWLLGRVVDVLIVQQLALVGMVQVTVLAVLGRRVAWVMVFPLMYLLLAVPAGEFLVPPLMDYTASFAVKALQLTGIPVYAEGRFITLPTGHWEVATACSGVRYLIASVTLGLLYAYISYRSIWRRLAFVALSIVLPIFANWVRAYGIIMLGHLSSMRLATGVDHIIYGWVFFGAVMLLMFWIGSFWREDDLDVAEEGRGGGGADLPAGGAAGKVVRVALVGLGAIVFAAAGPSGAHWMAERMDRAPVFTVQVPPAPAGWVGPKASSEVWSPGFPGATTTRHVVYERARRTANVYIILYNREGQGSELIAYTNRLFNPKRWKRLGEHHREVELDGNRYTVVELLYRGGGEERLVWWWYAIDGESTISPVKGKLLQALATVLGRSSGGSVIAVATKTEPHKEEEARRALTGLVEGMDLLSDPSRILVQDR